MPSCRELDEAHLGLAERPRTRGWRSILAHDDAFNVTKLFLIAFLVLNRSDIKFTTIQSVLSPRRMQSRMFGPMKPAKVIAPASHVIFCTILRVKMADVDHMWTMTIAAVPLY